LATASTLTRAEKKNGDAAAVFADGTVEIDAHSVQTAGILAGMSGGNLMNLADAFGIDAKVALLESISNRVDKMLNSELLSAARTLGASDNELASTADADDRRAAIIELIAKALLKPPDDQDADQADDVDDDDDEDVTESQNGQDHGSLISQRDDGALVEEDVLEDEDEDEEDEDEHEIPSPKRWRRRRRRPLKTRRRRNKGKKNWPKTGGGYHWYPPAPDFQPAPVTGGGLQVHRHRPTFQPRRLISQRDGGALVEEDVLEDEDEEDEDEHEVPRPKRKRKGRKGKGKKKGPVTGGGYQWYPPAPDFQPAPGGGIRDTRRRR